MKLSARLLLCLMAVFGLTLPARAQPALWEVRDDDSAIWLFGSFHVLPAATEWRTGLFDAVLADAEAVVFETDIRPAAAAQVGAEAYIRGIYADGTLLTDMLGEEDETRLREQATALNLPIGMLQAMRPWLAANTISIQAMAERGFAADGVEVQLLPGLAEARLEFLESGEQQLDVLSNASEDEQIAMLVATIEQLDELPKLMDKMLTSWRTGTTEQMGEIFLTGMGGFEEAFLERLIYQRNRNWMTPLEAMLVDNKENLVIVGAAHLIGDGSVLDLLGKAGYEVERIQ